MRDTRSRFEGASLLCAVVLAGCGAGTITQGADGLARKHDAVNLGQGFPNFDGLEDVKRAAIAAIDAGPLL